MKIALSLVAALLFTTHTRANDNLLMSFGLADLQVVNETEAQQVSGKGFVLAHSESSNWIEMDSFGEAFEEAQAEAFQSLELAGLNALEGLTSATSEVTFDLSEAESGSIQLIIQGSLTITSSTVVMGSAH